MCWNIVNILLIYLKNLLSYQNILTRKLFSLYLNGMILCIKIKYIHQVGRFMLLFIYFQVDENSHEKSILNTYNNSFNCNIECLKSKQKEAIKLLVQDQRDVVCMLPTGYGKSLIYELCQQHTETKLSLMPLVIEPLNIIIDQQLTKLGKNTSICLKNKMNDSDIDKIASGSFSYIFSHPEKYHRQQSCVSRFLLQPG